MDDASLSANPDVRQEGESDLGQIVPRLTPHLGHLRGAPEPLSGGITNRNYRARFGDRLYVIRVPGKDTSLLGIDRDSELAANEAAAAIGVAPAVAAMLSDPPCIVTEFIEGHGMSAGELAAPAVLREVADALRTMHASRAIPSRFDSFRIPERYAEVARRRDARIPREYEAALETSARIEAAISGPDHEPVPCHNDLLAANFIHDGARLRIVDWEYAGMGDRFFDLANFAVNNELDQTAREELLRLYFETDDPGDRRRATLLVFTFVSDFREAMWGVVQTVASDIEFDFADYARKHFARLEGLAARPEFEEALEVVRGD
jgi:thiamine kinase-like enzyme